MTAVAEYDAATQDNAWVERARHVVVKFAPLILLLILFGLLAVLDPATVSTGNLTNVLINAAPIAVLALAAMWVLVSGGLDLSAGFAVAMSALVMGGVIQSGLPIWVAFAAGIAAGAALGVINGMLVGVLAIPPFIATLATMAATQGAVLLLGQQGTVVVRDPVASYIGYGRIAGIPVLAIIALLVALAVMLIKRYTLFGVRTYGMGSDRSAVVARGVPIVSQTVLVYVFAGILVGITALMLVSRVQNVATNIANINLLLDAFAATIIGGTSLFGGRGTVTGTLIGALIISLISTSLVVIGVSASTVDFFKGLTIVVAIMLDAGIRFLDKRRL